MCPATGAGFGVKRLHLMQKVAKDWCKSHGIDLSAGSKKAGAVAVDGEGAAGGEPDGDQGMAWEGGVDDEGHKASGEGETLFGEKEGLQSLDENNWG